MLAMTDAVSRVGPLTRLVCLLGAIVLLSLLFAQAEIEIEGPHGWAGNLPTWRIENHPLLDVLWGGRPLTGYHVCIFAFMFCVFHLTIVIDGWPSLRLEARILGSLMLFWIVEDALWFALNPAFGIRHLTPEYVPWHKHWLMGLPTDYIVFPLVAALLLGYSLRRRKAPAGTAVRTRTDPWRA